MEGLLSARLKLHVVESDSDPHMTQDAGLGWRRHIDRPFECLDYIPSVGIDKANAELTVDTFDGFRDKLGEEVEVGLGGGQLRSEQRVEPDTHGRQLPPGVCVVADEREFQPQ